LAVAPSAQTLRSSFASPSLLLHLGCAGICSPEPDGEGEGMPAIGQARGVRLRPDPRSRARRCLSQPGSYGPDGIRRPSIAAGDPRLHGHRKTDLARRSPVPAGLLAGAARVWTAVNTGGELGGEKCCQTQSRAVGCGYESTGGNTGPDPSTGSSQHPVAAAESPCPNARGSGRELMASSDFNAGTSDARPWRWLPAAAESIAHPPKLTEPSIIIAAAAGG